MATLPGGRPKLREVNDPSKIRGEVFTPIPVINQMLDLLPKEVWNKNQKFLDPACGDSRILKEIHKRGIPKKNLYGCELDKDNIKNACINYPNLHHGDALEFDWWGIPLDEFVIIANPPFVEFGNGDIAITKKLYDKFYNIIRFGKYFVTVLTAKWAGKCYSPFRELVLDTSNTIIEAHKLFTTVSSMTNIVLLSNCGDKKHFINHLGERIDFDWHYDDIIPIYCEKKDFSRFLELRNEALISNYAEIWDDGFKISQFDPRIKEKPFKGSIKIIKTTGEKDKPPRFGFIEREALPKNTKKLMGWKVLFNRNGGVRSFSTQKVLEPMVACSRSCNFLWADSKEHAQSIINDIASLKDYVRGYKTTNTNSKEMFAVLPRRK